MWSKSFLKRLSFFGHAVYLLNCFNNNNNIRLLETTDKPQSLDNNIRIRVNGGPVPAEAIES